MDEQTTSVRSKAESSYEEEKSKVLSSVCLEEYLDHAFLFMSRQRVTSNLTRIKLFEKILDVKGSIVECGVHKGSGLMLYAQLSAIMEPYAFNRKIIGFDTFEGFRSISENDEGANEKMFADADYDVLMKAVELYDMNRAASHMEKCNIVKGDAVETIPKYVAAHPELIISLLYLDFDLYEPTKIALQHLLPLVPKGGIVAFDELNYQRWAGETVALKECLDLSKLKLKKFSFDPNPSYFVVGE